MKISLVVPVKNEEGSIEVLLRSIEGQTRVPDEVVIVDGGSTDGTTGVIERFRGVPSGPRIELVKTAGASPGKGRNIGVERASGEWIAFTDGGIKLDPDWLERLIEAAALGTGQEADIVYGNYDPVVRGRFSRCAALAYVPPRRPGEIRGKFIASCLMRRAVWETVGGFPDQRAAEDLAFMEKAEAANHRVALAPDALVHWELRPDLKSTFRKFVLYSRHNVWAGRQWDWHYGILRQYLVLIPFVVLAAFHSLGWLLALPAWLAARTAKRILSHRYEIGTAALIDPRIFLGVAGLVLTIDTATYIGWVQAAITRTDD